MPTQTAPASSRAGETLADIRLFIDGAWSDAHSGRTFDSVNPATGERLAAIHEADADDVDRAVRSARRAFDEGPWPRMPIAERCRILNRIAEIVLCRKEELARMESLDTGKPVRESMEIDIPRAAYNFQFFADFFRYAHTECFPLDGRALTYVRRQPVGVAALITPWNLPLYLTTWKVAPCLAAGNTCVVKPAELTPLTASVLAEIAQEAELPPGVLNVVQGFGATAAGEFLTRHPGVNLVSFTGETTTGKAIMAAASSTLKRLSFELGGKGAAILFEDASLDEAMPVALRAAFQNQGEVCLAGSRLLVQHTIYDEVLERLTRAAKEIRVGDPLDPATQMGALVSEEHWTKVSSYLDIARDEGARVLCGGKRPDNLTRGNFYLPTVIDKLKPMSRVCREEIFGPVVTVAPFKDDAEAVSLANDTQYGLSAVICTRDLNRSHHVAAQIEAGTVWINCWMLRDLRAPFGGFKSSGIGREGGSYSLDFFTEAKSICVKL